MKKLIYFLSITFLILQACSTNESSDNKNSNQTILIKKIIPTDGIATPGNYTYIFSYDTNKLLKIDYEYSGAYIGSSIYTYSGDFITKIEGKNLNNITSGYFTLSYSGNNISQVKYFNSNNIMTFQEDYTYRGDRTYTVNIKRYDDLGVYNYGYIEKLYLDSDGNLVKYEKFNANNVVVKTLTYTYDTKNGIYKNILGFNFLPRGAAKGGLPYLIGCYGNEISITGITKTSINYEYNSQNYPTSLTSYNSSGVKSGSYQFIY
jgi:hypothetical protein